VIARLTGQVVEKNTDWIILDVQGVGYQVYVSKQTASSLNLSEAVTTLGIHTHVREDTMSLYGFMSTEERKAFEALLGVRGVGPKAAIGILSGIDAFELARSIVEEDLARLCMVPGIGKKKAERLVLELKGKLSTLAGTSERPTVHLDDLRSALVNLGFRTSEVDQTLLEMGKQKELAGLELDELLQKALQLLRG
jgi:Holliday junction DNA helicase RuvA